LERKPIPEPDRPNPPQHMPKGKILSRYQQSHSAVLQTAYTTTHRYTKS